MATTLLNFDWQFILQLIYRINKCNSSDEVAEICIKNISSLIPYTFGISWQAEIRNNEAYLYNPFYIYTKPPYDIMNAYVADEAFKEVKWTDSLFMQWSNVFRYSDVNENDTSFMGTGVYQKYLKAMDVHYGLYTTLVYKGTALGSIVLWRSKTENNFSEKEMYIMECLKDHIALKLFSLSSSSENISLNDDTKEHVLNEFAGKVSIVHQYNQAADDITVERLISYGRTPYMKLMGGKSEEDEKLIDHAIEVTGLEEFRNRELSQLSGGQRQRVFIAMALAQNTKILFLDEPTTYLDIRYQLDILRLVKKLNREYGITIVMVLHEINQAIHFSDEVIGLKDGKVLVQGDPKDVITTESISELYDVHLNVADIDGQKFVLTV